MNNNRQITKILGILVIVVIVMSGCSRGFPSFSKDEKIWLGACMSGQIVDLYTTDQGLKRGFGEANQVTFSEKPSIEELFFKKLFIYAGMYFVSWLTEDPDDDEDISIVCATLGFGAAGYNQHLIDTNSQ